MKLLTRYSLINLLAMVLVFFVSSLILSRLIKVILIREMDGDLSAIEENIKTYVSRYDTLPRLYPLDEVRINFIEKDQALVARTFSLTRLYSRREKKMHNFRKLEFPLGFHQRWYSVIVAKPVDGMRHLSNALVTISIITISVIILISIVLNGFILKRLWKPFYEAMNIMRNFKLGKTAAPDFPKTKITEFAFMNESLLLATEKAEQDYLLLKEFTENASHEIQTPLSIIRSKLDMMIQEDGISQSQSEFAREAYSAVKKLSRLNQSLLLLTKIENQQFNDLQEVNLKEKIEEKIAQFQELWESHKISVTYALEKSIMVINPELVEILLNNLFSNATNHTISPGQVSITLEQKQLIISNTGHNTPLDEKRLFRRFYKQSNNSNHNGLGLSIIKQIAKVSAFDITYQFTGGQHSFTVIW